MNAELHLLVGLGLIHIAWAVAYVTGTLLDWGSPPPETRARALTEFVVRSATGIAVWGFGAFVLGMAGMAAHPAPLDAAGPASRDDRVERLIASL